MFELPIARGPIPFYFLASFTRPRDGSMPFTKLTRTLLILIIFLLSAPPVAGQETSPRSVVGEFQGSLLAVMQAATTLNVKGRYDRLLPPIEKAFHIPLMIRIATGSYWQTANQAQRTELIKAFKRMNISTVATLFDGYSGEVFKIVGEKPGPQNTLLVETKLERPNKSPVDIAYVMKLIDKRWRIIDVVVDNGITELTVRRSEYHRVLKEQGVDGLINTLNSKADELIAQ